MEMELLTRRIVIFGATGDLCKKKLIPALYQLWQKRLLPEGILIVGASRREHTKNPGYNILEIIQRTSLTGWILYAVILIIKIH